MLLTQTIVNHFLSNLDEGVVKSWLQSVLPSVLGFFWSVVLALLVFYIGGRIVKLVRKSAKKAMGRRELEKGVIQFVDSMINVGLWAVIVVIILELFGVQSSSVAAALASVGVAAGLALQGSLSNFAGGVLILTLHPFRVGDYIIEDTYKNEGTVTEISIFYTELRTIDNRTVVIPNGTLANTSLTNVTMNGRRRLEIIVGISYDSDIKKAKELLGRLISEEDRRCKEEEPLIFVSNLGESSVDIGLRVWVPTDEYWNIRWKMLEDIKLTFDTEGIVIPFNQLDVHMIEGKR